MVDPKRANKETE